MCSTVLLRGAACRRLLPVSVPAGVRAHPASVKTPIQSTTPAPRVLPVYTPQPQPLEVQRQPSRRFVSGPGPPSEPNSNYQFDQCGSATLAATLACLLMGTGAMCAERESLVTEVQPAGETQARSASTLMYIRERFRPRSTQSNLAHVETLKQRAWRLYEDGEYREASGLQQKVLRAHLTMYGADHDMVASDQSDLALMLIMQARYEEAESLLRAALATRHMLHQGEGHPDVGADLNNLALLLGEQGKHEEAEALYRQSIDVCACVMDPKDAQLAMWRSNLGRLLCTRGRYPEERYGEALPLFEQSHEAFEASLGPLHLDTLTVKEWAACLHMREEHWEQAEPLLTAIVQGYSLLLGDEHPKAYTAITQLAEALVYQQGRQAEAEPLYRRVLAVDEAQHGRNHPNTVEALNNLAGALYAQGKLDEALREYSRVLDIIGVSTGDVHPRYAATLNNIGLILKKQGRWEDAEPLFWRAVNIIQDVYGEEHPMYAKGINNVASLMVSQGKLEDAEPLLRECVRLSDESLGPEHPDSMQYATNLAKLLKRKHRFHEAAGLFSRVAELSQDTAYSVYNFAMRHLRDIGQNFGEKSGDLAPVQHSYQGSDGDDASDTSNYTVEQGVVKARQPEHSPVMTHEEAGAKKQASAREVGGVVVKCTEVTSVAVARETEVITQQKTPAAASQGASEQKRGRAPTS